MKKVDYSDYGIEYETENDPRIDFDHRSTPYDIASQIQKTTDEIISNCPSADWNENLITYKLIENLRRILSHYKLPGISDIFAENKFYLEAYKLTGEAEQSHGDIAIVITRRFTNGGNPTSGVAFYEAKASGAAQNNSWQYPSYCVQQLRRLVTNTPKLNYLLYSKESRKIGNSDWPIIEGQSDYQRELFRHGSYANAMTVDANFLKNCRNIDVAVSSIGLPFGSHFVDRVLSGRDLDYSRPVNKTIKRWLKYTRKSAPIIISISIQENHNDQFSTQLELPGFEKLKFPELPTKNNNLENKN